MGIARPAALEEARRDEQRPVGGAAPLVAPRQAADGLSQLPQPRTMPAAVDQQLRGIDSSPESRDLSRGRPQARRHGAIRTAQRRLASP